jgi:threonine aldolase
MRQVGVLAAAGLIAVNDMVERLADDHRRARWLAEALQGVDGVAVDLATVQTNMVYLTVADARGFVPLLEREGLLCNAMGPSAIRLVTHLDVGDDDVAFAAEAVRRAATVRRAAAVRRAAPVRGATA